MKRDELLDEAKRIVCGDRDVQYGDPEDSFHYIAEFWSTYLAVGIDRVDVANMMILLKVARTLASRKEDNFVDIAGYAACAAEISSNSDRRAAEYAPTFGKPQYWPSVYDEGKSEDELPLCKNCMHFHTPRNQEPCCLCRTDHAYFERAEDHSELDCSDCIYRTTPITDEPCCSCDGPNATDADHAYFERAKKRKVDPEKRYCFDCKHRSTTPSETCQSCLDGSVFVDNTHIYHPNFELAPELAAETDTRADLRRCCDNCANIETEGDDSPCNDCLRENGYKGFQPRAELEGEG